MVLLQHKLSVKLSQRQILTPGLVQMVSVLALNKLELKDMINAEMVETLFSKNSKNRSRCSTKSVRRKRTVSGLPSHRTKKTPSPPSRRKTHSKKSILDRFFRTTSILVIALTAKWKTSSALRSKTSSRSRAI